MEPPITGGRFTVSFFNAHFRKTYLGEIIMAESSDNDDRNVAPPRRDARGRFRKGYSGNPRGPRRKPRLPPGENIPAALLRRLIEQVRVTQKGRKTSIPTFDVMIEKLIMDAVNGSPAERMRVIKFLQQLGVIGAYQQLYDYIGEVHELNSEPGWTPELEAHFQELEHGPDRWSQGDEDDVSAFLDTRREEFDRFVAERAEQSRRESEAPRTGGPDQGSDRADRESDAVSSDHADRRAGGGDPVRQ
jgi:hypothetical protein